MQFFQEWARICSTPGTNDKAYPLFISQLQSSGMLKDDMSDRFFRILIVCPVCIFGHTSQTFGAKILM